VSVDFLGRPLIHRDRDEVVGTGGAAVVLEQQVLGHDDPLGVVRPILAALTLGRSRGGVLDIPVQDFFLVMWRG
jgi:hypothetical protein